jgi:hypothetical protein
MHAHTDDAVMFQTKWEVFDNNTLQLKVCDECSTDLDIMNSDLNAHATFLGVYIGVVFATQEGIAPSCLEHWNPLVEPAPEYEPVDFCWDGTIQRGAGTVPDGPCPEGHNKVAGLCYKKCADDYTAHLGYARVHLRVSTCFATVSVHPVLLILGYFV